MTKKTTGVLLALVLFSCKKKEEVSPVVDAAPPPSSASTSPSATPTAPSRSSHVEHPQVEAKRMTVANDDPSLAPFAEELKTHFKGAVPAKLAVQEVRAGRRYLLIEGANPLVLVVDDDGKLAWKKERPAAGITPPVGALALASGPKGRSAMAICDPPTKWIALRLWDDEGFPFADLQALEGPCESIGLFYWQHHGWIVTSAKAGELTRAQLVTEDGKLAWDKDRTFGARWRSLGAPSLAGDSKGSFMWVQIAGIESDPDQILAYRYDADGKPLFDKAVSLGPTKTKDRLTLERKSEGVVHVVQANADVTSSGKIQR